MLTCGLLGAVVYSDSDVRLLPDELGNNASAPEDSFSSGLLEHPHYTRPANFRGMHVPEVLLSGHHANIEKWRQYESLKRTYERREELLDRIDLSKEEKMTLQDIKRSEEHTSELQSRGHIV